MERALRILADVRTDLEKELPSKDGFQIKEAVTAALFIIGIIAVIMVIYSGILYITAAGDAGKLAKAKNSLIWSIVGLAVVILSYAIVRFVIGAF